LCFLAIATRQYPFNLLSIQLDCRRVASKSRKNVINDLSQQITRSFESRRSRSRRRRKKKVKACKRKVMNLELQKLESKGFHISQQDRLDKRVAPISSIIGNDA